MAENDQRSYTPRWRSAQEAPRAQPGDPLAELARLIGQRAPMSKLGRDRRAAAPDSADDRRGETGHAGSYPASEDVVSDPADDRYSAPEVRQDERDVEPAHREPRDDLYKRYEPTTSRVQPAPSRASHFRHEPDFAIEPAHDAADGEAGEADEAAYHDTDLPDGRYADEYEDERHDADDHAYADEYNEHQNRGRRSGFFFVAAVFALAVLGTAGAFAYRAMFGGQVLPALPPIIKAEGGPNKIIPSGVGAQDSPAREADANNAASRERLVSREERPVDIPQPATSTAPRSVATVPVFPDPPPMGGPGAVVGYSTSPTSSNPAMSTSNPAVATESVAPTAPAMTTATAPSPSANQASPPLAAAPPVSTAAPAVPGPKKIRTVTIRADQSDVGSSPGVPARPGSQSSQASNEPLSIVPSATEGSAAPARPRPAPAQPVPLNKPPTNQTASAGPAAPVATSGGYAVQVSSQRSEQEAQSSFRDLQAKYPNQLGGRAPIIRRADLGAKGIFFRAMVGPFASADEATELCSNLKAAGGSCLVQKN